MTNGTNSRYEVAIRVQNVMQLFNSLDPSPFRERDLDPQADEFIVGWVRELPHREPVKIVVELPSEQAAKPEAGRVGEALANYFGYRAEVAERELRELFRFGRWSLVVGLTVLVVCLLGAQFVVTLVGNAMVARVLSESLIIVGWVANWRPLEIYLYDWWPIRRRIRLFRKIATSCVEVRPI